MSIATTATASAIDRRHTSGMSRRQASRQPGFMSSELQLM
jgi:hypothetical protein